MDLVSHYRMHIVHVYTLDQKSCGQWSSILYTSTSRAPTHQSTLRRLELCDNALLTELTSEVASEINRASITITDKNVVL